MSADTDDDTGLGDNAPYEFTPGQLRRMDDDEARRELTVEQYERREKIIALHEGADEQEREWADEDRRVEELTVHADPDQLGTPVDVYGNDLLVKVNPEDEGFREAATYLEDQYGDVGVEEAVDLDEAATEDIAARMLQMLDACLLRWNGTDWSDLPEDTRRDTLDAAYGKWGLDGLMAGWADIVVAINEEREEQLDVIESFRNPEGRGRR